MTIPAPISRLTLIPRPEPREPRDDGPVVRRYRLMRLRLNGRRPAGERHGHL